MSDNNQYEVSSHDPATLVLFKGKIQTKYSGEVEVVVYYDRRFEAIQTSLTFPLDKQGTDRCPFTTISLKEHHVTNGSDPAQNYMPEKEEQESEWYDTEYNVGEDDDVDRETEDSGSDGPR